MDRTSIIVSNLAKADFLPASGHSLSLANQIKLSILNLVSPEIKDFVHSIIHWSDLPFLHRIIIIFKTPNAATIAYKFLESAYSGAGILTLPESVKLSLQENLLLRSRLSDALNESNELNVTSSLQKFRTMHNSGNVPEDEEYEEPKPKSFDAFADLQRLGIDISEFNSEEQLDELRASSGSSPKLAELRSTSDIDLSRRRSLTKTLFKPELSIKTGITVGNAPKSPTITLDETF